MSSARAIGAAVLVFFLPYAAAFLPVTALPRSACVINGVTSGSGARSFASATVASVRSQHRRSRSSSALSMFDEATLIGGAAALAGCGCGIASCLFMEYSAERTEAKGALTEEATQLRTDGVYHREAVGTEPAVLKVVQARMKYSAKFMEDDNAAYQMTQGVDVDDVTFRMRQALRANKSDAELKEEEAKDLQAAATAKSGEEDDGW